MALTQISRQTNISYPPETHTRRGVVLWRRGVVVITTGLLHATKPELRFFAASNPARGVSEIRNGEDFLQWSQQEIRLNAFRWSTTPQKQFITIIITRTFAYQGVKNNSFLENLAHVVNEWSQGKWPLKENETQYFLGIER